MSVEHVFVDRIHTNVCSISRWPEDVYRHPAGTYMVIAVRGVLDLLLLHSRDGTYSGFTHPAAVVDDFGNLVGVPQ